MSLTEQEINAILAEVKYKPGSRFYLDYWSQPSAMYAPMMCLEIGVLDAVTHKPTKLVFRNPKPFAPEDAEEVLEHCRRTAWLWEQHEADEWLTYRGVKPFDPHRGERTALMRRQLNTLDQLVADSLEYGFRMRQEDSRTTGKDQPK